MHFNDVSVANGCNNLDINMGHVVILSYDAIVGD